MTLIYRGNHRRSHLSSRLEPVAGVLYALPAAILLVVAVRLPGPRAGQCFIAALGLGSSWVLAASSKLRHRVPLIRWIGRNAGWLALAGVGLYVIIGLGTGAGADARLSVLALLASLAAWVGRPILRNNRRYREQHARGLMPLGDD